MRRFYLATLISLVSLTLAGCRQTTGPAGVGPLTPIGPANALSPVGTGQAPSLGPFGGPTRVTPPGTGSYVAPNNYMGGVVPGGQAASGVNPAGGFAAAGSQAGDQVIGSGVRVANWNETNSVVAQPGFGPADAQTAGVNSSAKRDPRSGGMQVIDLTGAPPPPGYQPSARSPNVQNPNVQNPNVQNPNVQNFGAPGFGGGVQRIHVPSPGQIANSPANLVPLEEFPAKAAPLGSVVPRTATAPAFGPSTQPQPSMQPRPSTQPVDPAAATGQNLPWRRPGTRF